MDYLLWSNKTSINYYNVIILIYIIISNTSAFINIFITYGYGVVHYYLVVRWFIICGLARLLIIGLACIDIIDNDSNYKCLLYIIYYLY